MIWFFLIRQSIVRPPCLGQSLHGLPDLSGWPRLRLNVLAALNGATPLAKITVEERQTLPALEKDENIMILPVDKGRCTVVLSTADCETKVNDLLSNNNTYMCCGYKNSVIDTLQKLDKEHVIDRQPYHRLYPGGAIPCIYELPKIHKEEVPLRPIELYYVA